MTTLLCVGLVVIACDVLASAYARTRPREANTGARLVSVILLKAVYAAILITAAAQLAARP